MSIDGTALAIEGTERDISKRRSLDWCLDQTKHALEKRATSNPLGLMSHLHNFRKRCFMMGIGLQGNLLYTRDNLTQRRIIHQLRSQYQRMCKEADHIPGLRQKAA